MSEVIRCLRCDKVITDPDPKMVTLRTDGIMFADGHVPADMVGDPALDQGMFEVGSNCYRMIAAAGDAGLRIVR